MRIKLSEKYQNEREEICNKIITILELTEDNTFLLCELDEDIEKQNKKEEMEKVRQSVDFTEGNASTNKF